MANWVAYIDDLGLLTLPCLLAHVVYLFRQGDFTRLALAIDELNRRLDTKEIKG